MSGFKKDESAHFGEEDDYEAAGIDKAAGIDEELGAFLSEKYPCPVTPKKAEEQGEESRDRISRQEREDITAKSRAIKKERLQQYDNGKVSKHTERVYLDRQQAKPVNISQQSEEVETGYDEEQEDAEPEDEAQILQLPRQKDEERIKRKKIEAERKALATKKAATKFLRPVTESKAQKKKISEISERIMTMKAMLKELPTDDSQIPEIQQNIKDAEKELADEKKKPSSSGGSQQKYLKYKIKYLRSQLMTWK
jgi:hypothetical protein